MLNIPIRFLTATLLGFILQFQASATGLHFFSGSWDDAQSLARKQHKALFVTAYTDWCINCQTIEQQAAQQPALAEFYNQHFVSYKVDIESPDGRRFAQDYGIQALPDCLFLDAYGNIIERNHGNQDHWAMLNIAMQAVAQLPDRATAPNKMDSFEENSEQAAAAPSHKNLTYTNEQKQGLQLANAIAQCDEQLLQGVLASSTQSSDGEREKEQAKIAYYRGINDLRTASRLERQQKMRDAQQKDPVFWHQKAADLVRISGKKENLRLALQWIEHSIALEPRYDSQETYSYILYKLGKKKPARIAAQKAIALANSVGKPCYGARNVLQALK